MTVHNRADWGAAPPKRVEPALWGVPYGVVHDIGGGPAYPTNIAGTLRGIQSTEQHGAYVDIAYCWGVDELGNQWQLRGDVHDGATLGYAGVSFSVLAICNASAPGFVPTDAMLVGIADCFKAAQTRGVLARGAFIEGHHWFDTHETPYPTVCPGLLETDIGRIRAGVEALPEPVQPKGHPMFNPPLAVISFCPNTRGGPGAWGLAPDGGVLSFGAPLPAAPFGVNGQSWFVGKPTAIVAPNAAEKAAGKWYTILNDALPAQRYAFPLA